MMKVLGSLPTRLCIAFLFSLLLDVCTLLVFMSTNQTPLQKDPPPYPQGQRLSPMLVTFLLHGAIRELLSHRIYLAELERKACRVKEWAQIESCRISTE